MQPRSILCLLLVGWAWVLLAAGPAQAQVTSADTFDIDRFSDAGNDLFETFYPAEEGETITLSEAIEAEKINPDHRVLITETADGKLALLTDQMSFHHIAEGTASNGVHWMATF